MEINGIVLINKERGVSSNFVVNKVKHILGANKAGHFGTLDVLGEGLLPVSLGKGTKLFDYFLNKDKVYKTIFKFGQTTETLDLEGEVTQKNDVVVTKEDLLKILPSFIGKSNQMPPIYSAKKINGKKAYELARQGKEVNLKPKEIEIYSLALTNQIDLNTFEFEVWCSSGTFIRSLCRDIAAKLNTYGVMSYIQRTKCGKFYLENAFTINQLKNGDYKLINLDEVFEYPKVRFEKNETDKLLNGMTILKEVEDNTIKCYGSNGEFLGIGRCKDNKVKISLRLI